MSSIRPPLQPIQLFNEKTANRRPEEIMMAMLTGQKKHEPKVLFPLRTMSGNTSDGKFLRFPFSLQG